MNNATKLSKDNVCYLLITVLSIGALIGMVHVINATSTNSNDLNNVFNCITQKVNKSANFTIVVAFVCYDNALPGAQKYASKPYQNPDLKHLPIIQPVSSDTTTKTIASDNGDKFLWNPLNDIGKLKSSSKIPNSDKVNIHFKTKLKDDKVMGNHEWKKPHVIDVFAKSTEKLQGESAANTDPNTFNSAKSDKSAWNTNNDNIGTKSSSKTKTSNIDSGNQRKQDVSNPFNLHKKINDLNNILSSQPNDLETTLAQKTDNSFSSNPIYSSFDLPFPAFGTK
jgi:hypothetical protein